MEHRHQAEELYKHIRCNSPEEGNQLTTVKEYLKLFICKCLPDQKFQIKEVPHVIMSSVKEEWFISIKASEAFERLEYYFSLVSCNPWKAEFHSIRKYSGFFQTKIASHLTGVESLFKRAGYTENRAGTEWKWDKSAHREIVLAIAFECLIASVECLIIHEIQVMTKLSVSALDIVTVRTSHPGDVNQTFTLLRKTHNLRKDDSVIKSPKRVDCVDQLSPRAFGVKAAEHELGPDGQTTDFKEGTLDDHLLASLQLIEEENSQTIKQPSVRPSDEWSFVQEGLRKKFGNKYFDGQRGDILTPSSKESKLNRDSGIGSGLPSEHPYGIGSGIQSEQPYVDIDVVKSSRNASNKIPQSIAHAQISQPERSPIHRSQNSWPQHEPQPLIHRPQFSSPFPQPTTKTEHLKARNKSLTSTYPPEPWLPKDNQDIIEHSYEDDIGSAIRPSRSITKEDVDTSANNTAVPVYSRISKAGVKEKLPSPMQCHYGSHSAPIASREMDERIHSSSLGDEPTWTCDHCTMKNRYSSNTCSVCSKSKDIQKSPDVRWGKQCSRCTLINSPEAYSCEACNNKLPEACVNPLLP